MAAAAAISQHPMASIAAWLAEDAALVFQGRLHAACSARHYPVAKQNKTCGVVLMLHGFTAGPWQYEELGPQLAAAGLEGFAARLPGHGGTTASATGSDAAEDPSDLPKSHETNRFVAFAERAYNTAAQLAESRGVPLYLVGFSAGGAVALQILQYAPTKIARAVLIAPLAQPKGPILRAFVAAMSVLPLGGRISDLWKIRWPLPPPRPDGWLRPGHSHFALGNVAALFRFARQARPHRRYQLPIPIQVIATASDEKVELRACQQLVGNDPRHGLYIFPRHERVPHAMLTAWENSNGESRALIQRIVADFLLHGRTYPQT